MTKDLNKNNVINIMIHIFNEDYPCKCGIDIKILFAKYLFTES